MPTLRIDDIDMHYSAAGQGDTLLLMHGLGSSGRDWERQIDAFAQRYRVMSIDLRGHGDSSKPAGPYSIPGLANDVGQLITRLRAQPAHVVGVSLGGMVALQLAVDRPDLVRRLIVVNSGPSNVPQGFAQHLAMHWSLFLRRATIRVLGMETMGKVIASRLFPQPQQALLRADFQQRWTQNDRVAYRAALEAIVGWSVIDRLQDLQCPTLVITGDRDYTPVSFKQEYLKLMPAAELVVIGDSGHGTPIDQADAFNRTVLDFLARSYSRSGTAPALSQIDLHPDATREVTRGAG